MKMNHLNPITDFLKYCTAINASVNSIPHTMIFFRINWQHRMLKGAPPV